MTQTVLVLGASGRFGRNAALAFNKAGWNVRRFDRRYDNLITAAQGADVIVNAWNPAYPDWAADVPRLHAQVIEAAGYSGSSVIVPGNVYVFGSEAASPWSGETPHLARNPLGRIRARMEEAYRASNVRTIMLRAGDFIDTEPTGNWFDRVMIAGLSRGKFTYPGNPDIPHAWAYLPDLCRAAVQLAEIRHELPRFADVPFAGYTLSGRDISDGLSAIMDRQVRLTRMNWLPVRLARPFWRVAPHLLEMRYLWDTPHSLDGSLFDDLLPDFHETPLEQALASAIPAPLLNRQIDPDQSVAARV